MTKKICGLCYHWVPCGTLTRIGSGTIYRMGNCPYVGWGAYLALIGEWECRVGHFLANEEAGK